MILIRFSDAESTHDGWPKVNSSPTPVSTSPMGRLAFESVLSSKTETGSTTTLGPIRQEQVTNGAGPIRPRNDACIHERLLPVTGVVGAVGRRRAICVNLLSPVATGDCQFAGQVQGRLFWTLGAETRPTA